MPGELGAKIEVCFRTLRQSLASRKAVEFVSWTHTSHDVWKPATLRSRPNATSQVSEDLAGRGSLPSLAVRRGTGSNPRPSRMPTACLVKPGAAWADFLASRWDSPIGAPVFKLPPPGLRANQCRARGEAQRRSSTSHAIGSQHRIETPVLLRPVVTWSGLPSAH
jgi:hypothetical protein